MRCWMRLEGSKMANCKNCIHNKIMAEFGTNKPLSHYYWCVVHEDSLDVEEERECDYYEVMTQADRIRSMTDEELAEMFGIMCEQMRGCYGCPVGQEFCGNSSLVSCEKVFKEWLQSPVEV